MSNQKFAAEDVKSRHVVFCQYKAADDTSNDDLLYVKEKVVLNNGEVVDNVRQIKNLEMPFWVVKPEYRNYEDKREFEPLERLREYRSNQRGLARKAASALGVYAPKPRLRQVAQSQYLYGTDVGPEAFMKYNYMKRWGGYTGNYTVATLDYETTLLTAREEITIGTLAFEDKVLVGVTTDYLANENIETIKKQVEALIGDELRELGFNHVHYRVVENDFKLVRLMLSAIHKWKPDFVSIHNINFDMQKMEDSCKHHGVDPKMIFSAPDVEPRFRHFKFHKDSEKKETATGKTNSKNPQQLWSWVEAPMASYFVCSMGTYWRLRQFKGNLPSYSLDYILGIELGESKLKYEACSHLSGPDWHKEMSTKHKGAYVAYAIMDVVRLLQLDRKTLDIQTLLPGNVGLSPMGDFSSGPRSLATDLHFELLEDGKVFPSSPPTYATELDKLCPGMNGWIITLSPKNVVREGVPIIDPAYGKTRTRLHMFGFDVDIASGYPNSEVAANAGKETRVREIYKVGNLSEFEQRRVGVNMTGLQTNAVDIAQIIYEYPEEDDLLEQFSSYLKETA